MSQPGPEDATRAQEGSSLPRESAAEVAGGTRADGATPGLVIVAGYGPVGRVVAERLERAGLKVTIIELNLNTIARQLALDKQVVYGDVADPEVLERAGIRRAKALVLAVPNEACAVRACEVARRINGSLFILARTSYVSQGMLATRAGADAVVIEEVVTAEAMQKLVVERLLGGREDATGDARTG